MKEIVCCSLVVLSALLVCFDHIHFLRIKRLTMFEIMTIFELWLMLALVAGCLDILFNIQK